MGVSWRHMLAGAGIATALGTVALTAAGQSCNTCGPVTSPPPSRDCCASPRNLVVNVPGVNVSVGTTSTVVASASASSYASSGAYSSGGASGAAMGYLMSGGGGYYSNPAVSPSTISNFTVEAGYETRFVDEDVIGNANDCIDELAVCIDDESKPHPASNVDG